MVPQQKIFAKKPGLRQSNFNPDLFSRLRRAGLYESNGVFWRCEKAMTLAGSNAGTDQNIAARAYIVI